MNQKPFQFRNAGIIKINPMLAGGDLGFDSHSPRHIPGQTNSDGNIIVDRIRGPVMVTMGKSWGRLSKVELQPDQLILSRKTSH